MANVAIELTMLELEALRKAVFAALVQPALTIEIGEDLLLGADKKLAAAGRGGLCVHCGERAGSGTEGLCNRCTAYRRKYERLPSEETLVESSRRRAERDQRPPDRRPRGRQTRNRP
jgi:hypothetical protein